MLQWIRKFELIIGTDNPINLSELHCKFETRHADLQTPNTCDIRAYNLSDDTVNAIFAATEKPSANQNGQNLIIKAGYENANYGNIFSGELIQTRIGRESPVDTYVDLLAHDGDTAYIYGAVNTTLAAGATVADQISVIAKGFEQYGITFDAKSIPDNLRNQKSNRGVALYGPCSKLLNELAESYGFTYSIQNGTLQIVNYDTSLGGEAVVLNSATGLIGLPEQTLGGVMVRCLINPKIRVGGLVEVNQRSIQQIRLDPAFGGEARQGPLIPGLAADGIYRVWAIDHQGDTRGQEWYSTLTCFVPDAETAAVARIAQ